MSCNWYDRDGRPISALDADALAQNMEYRRIARDTLPDGRIVSTIWMGLDHRYGRPGPPLIFETMVFPGESDFLDERCERYSTEAEARAGHRAIVAELTSPQHQGKRDHLPDGK